MNLVYFFLGGGAKPHCVPHIKNKNTLFSSAFKIEVNKVVSFLWNVALYRKYENFLILEFGKIWAVKFFRLGGVKSKSILRVCREEMFYKKTPKIYSFPVTKIIQKCLFDFLKNGSSSKYSPTVKLGAFDIFLSYRIEILTICNKIFETTNFYSL